MGIIMRINNGQLRKDITSSQSAIALSLLFLLLLTGRAIYVAISVDATTKGIFILIAYSTSLIFVGFIAGINIFNIKTTKQQARFSLQNTDLSKAPVNYNSKRASFSTSEIFIIEFMLENDGQCWQREIVEKSNMDGSKISRTLSNLERNGIVSRVRDGMGKRVILNKEELL